MSDTVERLEALRKYMVETGAKLEHVNMLRKITHDAERGQEADRNLSHMLERDRAAVADAVGSMKVALKSREWLRLGRGSYEYDDDRWKDEFGAACDELMSEVHKLEKVAADWEGCPTTHGEIRQARRPEGYVLVPVEPPPPVVNSMCRADSPEAWQGGGGSNEANRIRRRVKRVYRAGIAEAMKLKG